MKRLESAANQSDEPTSPWLTARPKALQAVQKALASPLPRLCRLMHWANGVYWLEITGKNNAGQVIARNLSDVGKLEASNRSNCS